MLKLVPRPLAAKHLGLANDHSIGIDEAGHDADLDLASLFALVRRNHFLRIKFGLAGDDLCRNLSILTPHRQTQLNGLGDQVQDLQGITNRTRIE